MAYNEQWFDSDHLLIMVRLTGQHAPNQEPGATCKGHYIYLMLSLLFIINIAGLLKQHV